jgi:hypothetical protein
VPNASRGALLGDARLSPRRSVGSLTVCPRAVRSCFATAAARWREIRPFLSGRGFSRRAFSARSSAISRLAWRPIDRGP